MYSLFRRATYSALTTCMLSGSIIDLGGGRDTDYQKLIKGSFKIFTVDINPKTNPDVVADLENPLDIASDTYDGAILMNVLEHVFNADQLLRETHRVIKPDSNVVAVVPFLFPIHPSPMDYHRFTNQALQKHFEAAGFKNIIITPIAPGVMQTRHVFISRLLPGPLASITELPCSWLAITGDKLLEKLSKVLRKQYTPEFYPLGYLVTAKK